MTIFGKRDPLNFFLIKVNELETNNVFHYGSRLESKLTRNKKTHLELSVLINGSSV